ncbi:MAG: ABC transporter substrate-binding protein [bacterium]|nr:ABC transporter substrate-binding protein [bacterium]
MIKARAGGHAIRAIAAAFQKSPFCLMSKKERGINTPVDLKGKRIGISNDAGKLMVNIVLLSIGLGLENVTLIEVGWDFKQPFLDDEIDVYTAYLNDEPLMMKAQGVEVTCIPGFKYEYDFYDGVYFVTEEMLQKKPELVQAFLEVTLRGWQEAFKDYAGTAQLVVDKYYPDGSVSQQTEALKVYHTLATLGVGDDLIGYMEEEFWQKGIDLLYEFGQIEKKIPATDVFTLDFLDK